MQDHLDTLNDFSQKPYAMRTVGETCISISAFFGVIGFLLIIHSKSLMEEE